MKATIDEAGRVVIPKAIRERLGIHSGPVEVSVDGAGIRIEPLADNSVSEREGRLIIPASGHSLSDEVVQALRDAGQR